MQHILYYVNCSGWLTIHVSVTFVVQMNSSVYKTSLYLLEAGIVTYVLAAANLKMSIMAKALGFGMWKKKLLEFALANDLIVGNTCFRKRESHLVIYSSSKHSTQIDYMLYRKSFWKAVNDVKTNPTDECVQ